MGDDMTLDADPGADAADVELVAPSDLADLDPVDEDDYRAFTPRPRLMSPVTWVLLFALTAAVGFLVGTKLEDGRGAAATPSASLAGAFAAARAAGGAGFGGFGGGAATGAASTASTSANTPAAVGTVKLVDGTNVYVADAAGNLVKVIVGPDAKIVISQAGTLADLHAGDTVSVDGAPGADGTLQATALTGVAATAPATPGLAATVPATPG
jgi:hypothetical protein